MSSGEKEEGFDGMLKAVLAEYNDCRDEIKIRIQERTRMTEFYIVGLAAIAGFAIQSENYYVFLIAPAYAVMMYTMIIGTYFYTDSLANYIREEIELKKIPYILGKTPQMKSLSEKEEPTLKWDTMWLGWETNFEKHLRKCHPGAVRKTILHFFSWGIVLVSTITLGYYLISSGIHTVLVMILVSIMLFVYGLTIEWARRKKYPGKRSK